MKVTALGLEGVVLLELPVFRDDRGFFTETWHQRRFAEAGLDLTFVQDNHSRSRRGVLRGLHYQLRHPQGKLVRVVRGAVFDVAVDIRRGSPTFGRWVGAELSEDNGRQIYIPPGYAHGFLVLSDTADVTYKCTALYAPGDEYSVRWDDPAVAIAWPDAGCPPVLSAKDAAAPGLAEADPATLPVLGEAR